MTKRESLVAFFKDQYSEAVTVFGILECTAETAFILSCIWLGLDYFGWRVWELVSPNPYRSVLQTDDFIEFIAPHLWNILLSLGAWITFAFIKIGFGFLDSLYNKQDD